MLIVGLGGTLRPGSSTERTLFHVLRHSQLLGADTSLLTGDLIDLPMYAPHHADRSERATFLVNQLRAADAIIVASPGYHGGVSGLVKNALDYAEDLSKDSRPYFDGRAVGCIATGAGWQGANATLSALRTIVHALRGWPTPLGIALNTRVPLYGDDGECLFDEVGALLKVMAAQLVDFAARFA